MARVCLRLYREWVHVLPAPSRRICLVSRFKGALKPGARAESGCVPQLSQLQAVGVVGPLNATHRAQLSSR
jgi:hypothetical protein